MTDHTYFQHLGDSGEIAPLVVDREDGTHLLVDDPEVVAWLAVEGNALQSPRVDLIAYAAAARYAKEIGGIEVGTAQIDTSRESQAMIANAYQFMQVSGFASTKFKTASGWVDVTADQLKSIALAVGAHVQACFAAEADLAAKIAAGTVKSAVAIDAAFAALAT